MQTKKAAIWRASFSYFHYFSHKEQKKLEVLYEYPDIAYYVGRHNLILENV